MGILGPLLGGREARRGAEASADAQRVASAESVAETRRQFDLSRSDQLPWLESGRNALAQLDAVAGGDLSSFTASPDYNFRRDEGMRGLQNTFAARGMGQSGNALRALNELNSSLASGEYGNFYNRLASRAGVGQTAANDLGALGANAAGNIGRILTTGAANVGNSLMAAGNARASGISGALEGGGNALGYFFGRGGWGGGGRAPSATGNWSGPR